jgi:hypothetical protein
MVSRKKMGPTVLVHSQHAHTNLLHGLTWDFLQTNTRYSESSHIHQDEIKLHHQPYECGVYFSIMYLIKALVKKKKTVASQFMS